jgi:hypothetical protein
MLLALMATEILFAGVAAKRLEWTAGIRTVVGWLNFASNFSKHFYFFIFEEAIENLYCLICLVWFCDGNSKA